MSQVGGQQGGGDEHEQASQDPVESAAGHAGRPGRAEVGAQEASGQEVDDDRPVWGDLVQWDRDQSGGQGGGNHEQAHGLVQDDGLQSQEPE